MSNRFQLYEYLYQVYIAIEREADRERRIRQTNATNIHTNNRIELFGRDRFQHDDAHLNAPPQLKSKTKPGKTTHDKNKF